MNRGKGAWRAPAALTAALMALMMAAGWLEDDAEAERRQKAVSRCVASGIPSSDWTVLGIETSGRLIRVYARSELGKLKVWECFCDNPERNS